MVQARLIISPETHNNDSVVAQACSVPARHLTLYQRVAADLGPGHDKGERLQCNRPKKKKKKITSFG